MVKTAYLHLYAPIDASTVEGLHDCFLNDIDPDTQTLYLALCTSGGSVAHGIALYNLLRSLPYTIITHNIGNVDSIGLVVFLTGHERHAEENATFMIHPVQSTMKTRQMSFSAVKEKISAVETDTQRIKKIINDHTTIPHGELDDLFQMGQVKTAPEAIKAGIIQTVKPLPFDPQAQKIVFRSN